MERLAEMALLRSDIPRLNNAIKRQRELVKIEHELDALEASDKTTLNHAKAKLDALEEELRTATARLNDLNVPPAVE